MAITDYPEDHEKHLWRVVQTDNYGRETVADNVLLDRLTKSQADRICEVLRENSSKHAAYWYETKHCNEKLCMGMSDLVD